MKKNRIFILFSAFVLLLLIGTYIYEGLHYKNIFLPKTTYNGIDVSGLNAKQANKKLSAASDKKMFTITLDGRTQKEMTKAEIGVSSDYNEPLEKALQQQNSWAWPTAAFGKGKNKTLGNLSIDDKKIKDFQAELSGEIDSLNQSRTKTENASITFNNGVFEINPEINGDSLDKIAIQKALDTDLRAGKDKLALDSYPEKPTIKKDDPKLQEELGELNKLTTLQANYSINGQLLAIPSETRATWLSYENDELTVNQEKVRAYVAEIAAKYNTSSNPSTFKSTRRGEVQVPAGSYSWTIQTDQETTGLIEELKAGKDFTRVPITSGATGAKDPLIGNTYIEVDLQNQHMWYYKDGAVQLETDIVSGKPATPTPTGVFYVWNKERNATLRGEDYATPVDHWMPIDWTGVGIHDSPWQTAYGGDRHINFGSHGCINTPPDVVTKLYNSINIGIPVIVF